jgi:acyl carrier protein
MIERVITCISDVMGYPPDDIEHDHDLAGQLGLDSLDMMSVVMALETEHSIRLNEGDIAKCATVQDLADLVKRTIDATV